MEFPDLAYYPDAFNYETAEQSSDAKLWEIGAYYHVDIADIRWKHFVGLLQQKYGVEIIGYSEFTGNLDRIFAGSLLVQGNDAIIGYNSSSRQPLGRRHFTVVHEGVHYFDDAVTNAPSQSFSDIAEHDDYTPEEQLQENHANYTASLLMCNDIALERALYSDCDCSDIEAEFQMTNKAVMTRITNYLNYNLNIPRNVAYRLSGAFGRGDTAERRSFLNILVPHYLEIKQWIDDIDNQSFLSLEELYNGWGKELPNSHWYQAQHIEFAG